MNNYQKYYLNKPVNYRDDRFVFPFLTGALIGGAAVGLTRPRPIYNVAPANLMSPPPPRPYSYYSYGGYVPQPYGY